MLLGGGNKMLHDASGTRRPSFNGVPEQMWSLAGLNVESYVEPPRRPRSRVVDHRPPGPLVHLSQISGPVRSFSPAFARFRGFLLPVGVLRGVLGCAGRLRGAGLGCPGALKPTVRGLLSVLRVRQVCLVGRRPWGNPINDHKPRRV